MKLGDCARKKRNADRTQAETRAAAQELHGGLGSPTANSAILGLHGNGHINLSMLSINRLPHNAITAEIAASATFLGLRQHARTPISATPSREVRKGVRRVAR